MQKKRKQKLFTDTKKKLNKISSIAKSIKPEKIHTASFISSSQLTHFSANGRNQFLENQKTAKKKKLAHKATKQIFVSRLWLV